VKRKGFREPTSARRNGGRGGGGAWVSGGCFPTGEKQPKGDGIKRRGGRKRALGGENERTQILSSSGWGREKSICPGKKRR